MPVSYLKRSALMNDTTDIAIEIEKLDYKRKEIEKEIKTNLEILRDNNTDMHENLVDVEGFPRTDINILAVRAARNKIICNYSNAIKSGLRNDHQKIGDSICSLLPLYYGYQKNEDFSTLNPFLLVNSIEENSHAFKSGFISGDKIFKLGDLTARNYQTIQNVGSYLSFYPNKTIDVYVLRGQFTRIRLVLYVDNTDGDVHTGLSISAL
ncbi:hypothetical protein HZS_5461 [Henneguya salminicola]|nr:hypothetical protein HZS_5461 [Henneguya salminicola]